MQADSLRNTEKEYMKTDVGEYFKLSKLWAMNFSPYCFT